MGMPNWTPGPWVSMNGDRDIFGPLGGNSGDGLCADKADGWQVAEVDEYSAFCDGEPVNMGRSVMRANARLIAQSPCMADVLLQWSAAEVMGDEKELQSARDERDRILAELVGGCE